MIRSGILATLLCAALLAGCSSEPAPETVRPYAELAGALTHLDRMARLDTLDTKLISSFDRSGGNDDFNNYVRKGPDGWIVLADLKGPGYVSRFWFTGGADDGSHRFRFYFDNEKTPRLDLSAKELCGGQAPFTPPLANYENYCWSSWVPIPYARRLVVMAQEGGFKKDGWPRIFYQINYSTMPPGEGVESFRLPLKPEDEAALDRARAFWAEGRVAEPPASAILETFSLTIPPGERAAIPTVKGPGIVRRLAVTPQWDRLPDATARETVLRRVVQRARWDGAPEPSVETPLGDFFGSMWRRTRFQSLCFGMTNDTFLCAFPMPFAESADFEWVNESAWPVELDIACAWTPLETWDPNWAYFHATWSSSGANETGRPHPILRATGRGRYLGCLLGVVSLDRTWWVLEGDETMSIDGERAPSWHGTGLEDYFNGGWYYQNVMARPLYGLPQKSFFRIVQYRLHPLDPVGFNTSFDMFFERGPDNNSHGAFESVAYYYLEQPARAAFDLSRAGDRSPPEDPLTEPSIMTDLANYERQGDYAGASEYIEAFLDRYPSFPFAPMLRLRRIAYVERMNGIDAARPLYARFLAEEADPAAREQARLLLWFHESPDHALVSLYSTVPARVLLDGRDLLASGKPEQIAVAPVTLKPGRHALALYTRWGPYPNWSQAALRTHDGLIMTTPDWKQAFQPSGNWSVADYDDGDWSPVIGLGVKGPPEEPRIWQQPHALVDMTSLPNGLRANDEYWPDRSGFFVFRTTFETRGPTP